MTSMSALQDGLKRMAAARAVAEIHDGMIVGLGSGTTAACAIELLAKRVARGLRISGIPTSSKTATLARRFGVPLTNFTKHRRIDVTIDGADQAARDTFDLIKGRGGALLREKIVASVSDRVIIVVDESKVINRLDGSVPLPVEVVAFGWQTTLDRLSAIGCAPQIRLSENKPFVTDGGHYIADCTISDMSDPKALALQLLETVGVVEAGLFIGIASQIIIGHPSGVEVLER